MESVIRGRIPNITSLINKTIEELESEMDHLGRPIAVDAGVSGIHLSLFPERLKSFYNVLLTNIFQLFSLTGSTIHHPRTLSCI